MEHNRDELIKKGSESLKKLALNEHVKQYVLENKELFTILKRAANRYIGGEHLDEVLLTISKLNKQGFAVTTDYMGESIYNAKDAILAQEEFVTLLQAINGYRLNSSISLDLSHIGLLVSDEIVRSNLSIICDHAKKTNTEVIISMEGIDRTDKILDIYKEYSSLYDNVGITLQAYLHRTIDDFKDVIQSKGSVRIVKGAFDVPSNVSIARGAILNDIYLGYIEELLAKDHPCSIASHDHFIFQESIKLIEKHQPITYTLERLLGIENKEFELYKEANYNCRMYVVYGREWFLYLCNRWAEYPLNIFRGLDDMMNLEE